MKVFIVIAMFLVSALAAPGVIDNKVESDSTVNKMMQYFGSCADTNDLTTCLAVKGITALNRASRASNIEVTSGITLTRDQSSNVRAGKAISENEIVSSLPTDPEQRNGRLYDMALETFNTFLSSHNMQIKFPAEASTQVARAIDEGRGKLKKFVGPLILGLGAKVGAKMFAIVPLMLVGLALLAFKALIISKVALLMAIFLTISKAFSGVGGGSSSGGGLSSGLGLLGKVAGLSAGAGLLGGALGSGLGSGGLGGGLGGGSTGSGYSSQGQGASTGSGYSSGNGYASNQQSAGGWSSGGSNSYPYARSYDEGQDLAYQGYSQETQEATAE